MNPRLLVSDAETCLPYHSSFHHPGFTLRAFLNTNNFGRYPKCHFFRVTPVGSRNKSPGQGSRSLPWADGSVVTTSTHDGDLGQARGPKRAFVLPVPGGRRVFLGHDLLQAPTSVRCCSSTFTFFSAAPKAPTSGTLAAVTLAWEETQRGLQQSLK